MPRASSKIERESVASVPACPDASVVVIAFNEERRIDDCLKSILRQNLDIRFEVVVVDDGSTDGTLRIVDGFASRDSRVRAVSLPTNRGRGAARAAGVTAARGRHIAFVDADIVLPDSWLATVWDALDGCAAVGGHAVPDGDVAALYRIFQLSPKVVAGTGEVTGNNVLFDGDVLRTQSFDPTARSGEDFRLVRRLRAKGLRMVAVDGLTVRHLEDKSYRQHVLWLFESGRDATSLLAEFREVRFPDMVWASWLGLTAVSLVLGATRDRRWLLAPIAGAAATGVGHVASRFENRPRHRFVAACVAHTPAMVAYLVGRTLGIPKAARQRREIRGLRGGGRDERVTAAGNRRQTG
jgi:glycosyltransferase involved in cell wall biosynthesis